MSHISGSGHAASDQANTTKSDASAVNNPLKVKENTEAPPREPSLAREGQVQNVLVASEPHTAEPVPGLVAEQATGESNVLEETQQTADALEADVGRLGFSSPSNSNRYPG